MLATHAHADPFYCALWLVTSLRFYRKDDSLSADMRYYDGKPPQVMQPLSFFSSARRATPATSGGSAAERMLGLTPGHESGFTWVILLATWVWRLVPVQKSPSLLMVPEIIQAREELRFEAAKAAAPYVHARLQTTTLGGDPEKPLKVDTMSELEPARRCSSCEAAADA